jgi:hypothetical protein
MFHEHVFKTRPDDIDYARLVFVFIPLRAYMASSKRHRTDENTSFSFIDQSTPVPKRPRLKAQPVTLAEIKNLQQERAQKDQAASEAKARAATKHRIEQVLGSITAAGYETLYAFVDELLNIRDQQFSSRVSNMLGQHGEEILNSIRARQPDIVKQWAVGISGEILAEEGQRLAKYLQPRDNQTTSDLLQQFSLERIMSEAEDIAPTLCRLLRQISTKNQSEDKEKVRKNHSLVSLAFIVSRRLFNHIAIGTRNCDLHACTDTQ